MQECVTFGNRKYSRLKGATDTNILSYEALLSLKNRNYVEKGKIHCQRPDCNSLNTMDQFMRRIKSILTLTHI